MNNLNHDTHFYEPSDAPNPSKHERTILWQSIILQAVSVVVIVGAMIGGACWVMRLLN